MVGSSIPQRGKKEHVNSALTRPNDPTYAYIGNYLALKNMKGACTDREWQQLKFPESYDYSWDQQDREGFKMAGHVNIHQQHPSDSNGETSGCWSSIQKALCGCCIKQETEREQRNRERERQSEEERYRGLERVQKEERQIKLQRKRLQREARQQEIQRGRTEKMEQELHRLRPEEQEWTVAVNQQTWRLTNEEIEELQELRKMERERTDVESDSISEDERLKERERALQMKSLKQMERERITDRETRKIMSETEKARILYLHVKCNIHTIVSKHSERVRRWTSHAALLFFVPPHRP